MAKTQTLTDNFTSDDLAALWPDTTGTVAVAGGQCSIQIDTSYSSALASAFTYDLTGSYVFAKITPYIAASTEMDFLAGLDANDCAKWVILGDQIQAGAVQGGVFTASPTVTYDPAAHQWLRVREASGTLYFDTSPDGSAWVNFYSAAYAIDLSANAGVFIGGGDFGADTTGTTYVTSVNIPGAGALIPATASIVPAFLTMNL